MHGAPSVSYPVGRSLLAGSLLLAAWLLGLVACTVWAWQGASASRLAVAAAACLAAGAWTGWWWHRQPSGLLAWDAGAWSWSAGGPEVESGSVKVQLDLQSLLLLRFTAQGDGRWLWVERARLPGRWDALRRAVYSRANPEAPPRAEPPSATP
jgi:toxin CptA